MTHIAVLGSTNMDLVAYVEKAPQRGETVTGREFRTIPGGKGANQAIAAVHAGATDVTIVGAVGNDAYGAQLRATFEHSGVDTDHLRTVEGPSGTAHIVVDDEGGNAIVVIPAANGTVDHLAPGDEATIATADALLLQLEIPWSRWSRARRRPAATVSGRSSPPPRPSPCRPNSLPPWTCWSPTSTRPPPSPAAPIRARRRRPCSTRCPR